MIIGYCDNLPLISKEDLWGVIAVAVALVGQVHKFAAARVTGHPSASIRRPAAPASHPDGAPCGKACACPVAIALLQPGLRRDPRRSQPGIPAGDAPRAMRRIENDPAA